MAGAFSLQLESWRNVIVSSKPASHHAVLDGLLQSVFVLSSTQQKPLPPNSI